MKLLVYGTLRRNEHAHGALSDCKYQGEVRLPGYDMINLGGFPGIVPNPQNKNGIVGEVFDGISPDTLRQLDYYEGYNPAYPEHSHYLRKEISVGGDDVFVYVFNRPADREWFQPIPSGDWKQR